jgi:6-phosphofructokinase 1
MKIGVVHFGWATAGTAQIVRTLIEGLSIQEKTIYGIECNRTTKDIELKEIMKKSLSSKLGSDSYVLRSFPINKWNEDALQIADKLSFLDKVIILGGSGINVDHLSSKLLHVPVSIFNDVEGSQYTLGYDTAINSIVENIESVRDTASSLNYGKLRVFCVQIPGNGTSQLLVNSALAVEGKVVATASVEEIEYIKQHVKEKEMNEEGYTFLLMNQEVDPKQLEGHFEGFDLDWRFVEIDESQLGGPYPTALDRLIANQLKTAILDWSLSDQSAGHFVIQDNNVLLKCNATESA